MSIYSYENICYNSETGAFSKISATSRPCGNIDYSAHKPYLRIQIRDKKYRAHRMAWFMVHGYWPLEIDHINGNSLDNKISNLRDVSRQENNKNTMIRKDCISGVMGVKWRKQRSKWIAMIYVNGVAVQLKSTDDFFEAVCARKSAEKTYGFGQSHGKLYDKGFLKLPE